MTMWSMVNGIWIHVEGLPAVLRCQTSTLARGLPEVGGREKAGEHICLNFHTQISIYLMLQAQPKLTSRH